MVTQGRFIPPGNAANGNIKMRQRENEQIGICSHKQSKNGASLDKRRPTESRLDGGCQTENRANQKTERYCELKGGEIAVGRN